MIDLSPFRGGRRLMLAAAAAGALGLLLTGALALWRPRQAGASYLVSFTYWSGIAVAALAMLMTFHAAHSRWPVALRRPLEAMSLTIVPLGALFLPAAFAMRGLFGWVSPSPDLDPSLLAKLRFRGWYLNLPFFYGRAVAYFVVWGAVAWLLFRWSVAQDADGAVEHTGRQRRLSAGALPAVGFAMTFAAYDWIMSPALDFHSQILGLYWFAGSVVSVFALLAVVCALAQGPDSFGRLLNANHFHSLGKLLLAFVAFWAWMAFSQFMLIWIANLPDQISFFVVRVHGGWGWIGGLLIVGQFVLPFLALLSRDLKRRPRLLATVGIWNLAVHYFDVYWLLAPTFDAGEPRPALTDLTSFVGIGGVAVASAIFLIRGRFSVPIRDPHLEESLRYAP